MGILQLDDVHWTGINNWNPDKERYVGTNRWELDAGHYSMVGLQVVGAWADALRPATVQLRLTYPPSTTYLPNLKILAVTENEDTSLIYSGRYFPYEWETPEQAALLDYIIPPNTPTLVTVALDWSGLGAEYRLWRIGVSGTLYSYGNVIVMEEPGAPAAPSWWMAYKNTHEEELP